MFQKLLHRILAVFFITGLALNNTVVRAQMFNPEFEHFNIEQGLPHSTVNSIVNDSYGYIWIGTEGGIARYDSRSFKIYQSDSINNLLLANMVLMIHEDEDSVIWVGTRHSLEMYLRESDSFRHFIFFPDANNNESQMVTDFCKAGDHDYFICTNGGGLYHLELKEGIYGPAELKQAIIPEVCSRFSSVCKENDSIIWFGTYTQGIYWYNRIKDEWKHINIDEENEVEIRCIVDSDPIYLYIGTYDRGLCRMNKFTGEFDFFQCTENNPSTIGSNRILAMYREDSGNIWIGTDGGGLNYFNAYSQSFMRFQNKGFDSKSLSNNSVYAVTIDREGNIWTGNYHGGVNLSKGNPSFYFLGSNPGYPNSLDNKLVTAILRDHNGNLWVGTDGNGINIYNGHWGRIEKQILPKTLISRLKHIPVLSIMQDSKGFIWIGTYLDGFYRFSISNKSYKNFKSGNPKYPVLHNDDIRCFYEHNDNTIWIGTNGGGIYIYNPDTDQMRIIKRDLKSDNSISLDWIRDIISDSYGFVWIATAFGLNSYDPVKEKFVNFFHSNTDSASLSDNMIFALYEDRSKRLWAGTNNGLSCYDRSTNTFKNYYTTDGLPSNTIVNIVEDKNLNLWLPTNNGLSLLNLENNDFTNYYRNEGLKNYSFIEHSRFVDNDDRIYLGTIEGLVWFHPDSVGKTHIDIPIRITNLLLFNQSVKIGEKIQGKVILDKDITLTKAIKIKYNQNVISLEYTALYYKDPSLIKYRYKLEGFDEQWNLDLFRKQSVTYTNLKPGDYNFIVQIIDHEDKEQVLNTTQLGITIIPPFWMRIWFRLFIIGIILFLIYSWYKNRVDYWKKQKEELKRRMLEDQLRNEKEQMQLRSEKLRAEFEKQEAEMNLRNAQLISFALQLTHKNEIMRKIKNRLNQYYKSIRNEEVKNGIISLNDTIDQEFKLVKDWERFEKHFNEVHRDFFKKLKSQYPDMGVSYLRLCAYLKLELSTKEIASLMNISSRGVEKARSRLRKKFGIDRNEGLSAFLAKV